MRCTRSLLLLALSLAACASAQEQGLARLTRGIVIDLSYAYDEDTIYWPTAEGFRHEPVTVGHQEAGYYYAAYDFRSAEHGGTHIDAPRHFAEGKQTVDEIPLERLMGPGIVVDVSAACAADRDYRVTLADLAAWEDAHGRIPEGAIVLLRTGFGRFWPDRERYMGTARRGPEAVADLHFPGLHADAARWLATQRSIGAVGIDTPSIDHGPSKLFESHRILFAHEVPALENVARLEELPPDGFDVIALPMKIRGGSGAPVRIAAILR